MKNRSSLATLAASAALFTSACGSELATPPREMQESFDAVANHWESRGVHGIESLSLASVASGILACGPKQYRTQGTGTAAYCRDKKLIIVGEASYNLTVSHLSHEGISAQAVGAAVFGHEFGHHVIAEAGLVTLTDSEQEDVADCIAGATVKAIAPDLKEQVEAVFEQLGTNNAIHGTGEERKAAFNNGFANDMRGCDLTLSHLSSPA